MILSEGCSGVQIGWRESNIRRSSRGKRRRGGRGVGAFGRRGWGRGVGDPEGNNSFPGEYFIYLLLRHSGETQRHTDGRTSAR